MAERLMALGPIRFELNTIVYQSTERSTTYNWPSQARLGGEDALQYVGRGAQTLTLQGVIYPHFRGGLDQMDILRALAETGQPQLLVDGRGRELRKWAITTLTEGQSLFLPGGAAQKITFTIGLSKYGEDSR